MDAQGAGSRPWEYVASGLATAAATVAALVSEDFTELRLTIERLDAVPGWLRTIVSVPKPVWWLITVALAALLFWSGSRLSRRWGSIALLLAPAVMLALQYVIPWVLYAPVRAALPAAGG